MLRQLLVRNCDAPTNNQLHEIHICLSGIPAEDQQVPHDNFLLEMQFASILENP